MRNTTTKCIILGHKNLTENDKLVFLYSEEFGKIKAIAKGARKITSKFTGHLETLNICNASIYFGPKRILITEISSDSNFRKKNEDLDHLKSALQIAEITDKILYENQHLENLIKLIEKSILHLKNCKNSEVIALAYIVKLLDKVGLLPDFKETKTKLDHKFLKFFHYLKTEPLSEIKKISLSEQEEKIAKNYLKTIIEQETEQNFSSFF